MLQYRTTALGLMGRDTPWGRERGEGVAFPWGLWPGLEAADGEGDEGGVVLDVGGEGLHGQPPGPAEVQVRHMPPVPGGRSRDEGGTKVEGWELGMLGSRPLPGGWPHGPGEWSDDPGGTGKGGSGRGSRRGLRRRSGCGGSARSATGAKARPRWVAGGDRECAGTIEMKSNSFDPN